ncbi:MAG: PD40 domain-containing protein [Ignavibacteria bacterium]|nr:PD40 domain-containing protein [Ignavibacteria bacterium]
MSPSAEIEARSVTERHLKNIRQLTFGGDNAEAYFSFDGKLLSFQKRNKEWEVPCDQIYVMDIEKAAGNPTYTPPMVSTGLGRTTCAYFMPDDKHVLYASTHEGNVECPPDPEPRADHKYVWPLYNTFNIYVADMQGNIVKKLTDRVGYDAEATLSPQGDKIVFTSDRSGDLELWTMDVDGGNLKQITTDLGYDGGAFFSADGKRLVYRSSRPKTDSAIAEYKSLLAQGLVTPTEMEIYTCNVNGTNIRQVTHLGKANWAPYFHPTNGKIIFASNHHSQRGYDFQLYMVDENGNGLEQITTESIFNAFAVFSADGKQLVWSSNRNNGGTRETNVFIADFD